MSDAAIVSMKSRAHDDAAMVTDDADAIVGPGNATAVAEIQRDSDVWFDDGNIVVVAHNTAFRCHKTVLSRHSVVFMDLFAVPQPASASTGSLGPVAMLDDCPAVHVSGPSYDFRELLLAIYGATFTRSKESSSRSLP
ncbi:hypothetical protein C8Q80DRAFT_684276 [Daedaleopsis nitida]|nr:hypothetical protein C8Q80DRAFT_684276 [Daedaleopsis nitida]